MGGRNIFLAISLTVLMWASSLLAGTEGTIRGSVLDGQEVAVSGAKVRVLDAAGNLVKETTSSATGEFTVFPIEFGDYSVEINGSGLSPYRTTTHVSSGAITEVIAHLVRGETREMVINVRGKRAPKVQASESRSSVQLSREDVRDQPQGDQVKLPKLIASTTPGVVQGAFGQLFFRGNHANIQYQIDGVQLPESPSNTFGESFSPRNIDHMEIITGGIPAEYGQRLSAVVNIVSKTGPETPGGSVEANYGSYNTFSPTAMFGGSTAGGSLHYYISANYNRTDRGLDTPQPISATDVTQGGSDSIHNFSEGHNQFVKLDWIADNENKLTFVAFNSYNNSQIPTYPAAFGADSVLFTGKDSFGNGPYLFLPSTTNDSQRSQTSYVQAVWKHTFSDKAFLQLAPYFKYSYINVQNDPPNDLLGATAVKGQAGDGTDPVYASFYESRHVNNFGLKGYFTWRPLEDHLVKTGFQVQASQARGFFTIQTAQNGQPGNFPPPFSTPNDGYTESVYVQDDYAIVKSLVLNAGLRFDATQLNLEPGTNPTDSSLQPRVGLAYSPTDTTKLHAFYGKLFQPAPVENLRAAFKAVAGGAPTPYDIKAERADYYEVGVAQAIQSIGHVVSLTTYRKNAQNLLDDAQLLNTAIAQPINFDTGFVYGTEFSVRGQLTEELSDFLNYTYSIAQGKGLSGGIFTGNVAGPQFQYLDHAQMHTMNLGATYRRKNYWLTVQGIYGSGLRTGSGNSLELPHHFTMDATVGYELHGDAWWNSGVKIYADVLNILDNRYAISVANGFNGSHYAAGRQYFVHLVKDF